MPELPEVETTLRGIEPFIINKKHNDTNNVEKKLFSKIGAKIGRSIYEILIGIK